MTVNLSALAGAGAQFLDNNGNILSGGKLYSYAAGTTTPQTAYTSASGATAHTNPIILDSAGRVATGEIWLTAGQNYKFVLETSTEVTIATWDNITGINGTGIATAAANVSFTGFEGQTGTVQDLADDDGSDWIGFDPLASSGVARSAQDKSRDIVSVKDFGAVGDGVTNDTSAIQAAVTAQAGKSLYFPDGNYVNNSIPTGINNLVVVGTPRLNFVGTKIPFFSGVYTGDLEIAVVAGCIRYYDATTTPLGNGYINGETVQIVKTGGSGGTATVTTSGVDSGVNTVTLAATGSGYTDGSALLTSSTGSGCQVTITTSAGAITSVTKKSAYYFLKDGQERHDPILMGPVTDSGTGSVILKVGLDQLGINPVGWTPSGFVCGPDETLTDTGVTFGASVSPTSVTIFGTYNAQAAGFVSYNAGTGAFVFSGIGYDSPVFSSGVLTITRPTNSIKAAANYPASVVPVMRRQTAADWGANIVDVSIFSTTATTISLLFTDASGVPLAAPDARIKFFLTDSLIRNPNFNFGADPGGGTNIWMVGAFTRRKDLY